nr:DNA polymerase III subunit alpha [Caldalkalibacillus salinus]
MIQDFVHLHVHSEYSLLDGAGRIEQLVETAKAQGMQALALTDHGSMYGTIPFYKACKQHGIKPIIGVEAYVTNQPLDRKMVKGEQKLYHLLLLAETYEGYQNLMKLTTKAHLEGFYYKPRVIKEWLAEYHQGIIATSACLAGEVQQALLNDEEEKARQIALEYQNIFGRDYFYLEMQDHGLAEQKKVNHRLVQLSEETGIPLVVTNDVHYVHKKDAVAHDCLLCIGTAKKVKETERMKFPSPEFYLKTKEEMQRLFPHVPEALQASSQIAQRCEVDIPLGSEILPHYPVPEGHSALSYLQEQCIQGAKQRYGTITDEIEERLNYELQVIGQMGYADYFLIVWDFMRFAHEKGIMTGPGRGSAAGSLVAYVLNITNIDPIKYKLLFERFLNPERVTMPDIDIDFSDRRRDEVIQYVLSKYGDDRVAQIITFGTMGAKAAIRDIGRVLDIPLPLINKVAKSVPSGLGVTLERARAESSELQALINEDERIKHLYDIAVQLEGTARHSSTHAAGVVISKDPLPEYVPLQEGHEGVPLTQYAMEDLEDIGLLKMDFLGLRNLSLLEEILHIINQGKPQEEALALDHISFQDEATFQLLSEGDTTGVFQLESAGMRSVLRRLQPSSFEDVIAVLALYRPGPMENIPLFIDAKFKRTDVEYPHEDLKPILEDTYGIIVYQEQIMQIASSMAGFSLGEADLLRRAVGKKKREILEQERTHFVQGCLQQGYNKHVAEHVYDLIVRFADYGFNRSHSAAYAVIAYQLAYLKAHYPVAFLASLLSTSIGATEKVADYLSQASRRQIKVLPPSVQHSQAGFTVEHDQIRIGLSVIKNVGYAAIKEILAERSKRPFQNMLDFCQRVNLKICNRRVIESLIMSGACDDLGMHRAQALANLDDILDMAEQAQGLRDSDQLFFFADEIPDDYPWIDVPPYAPIEQLKAEKEVLGFYLSGHPLDPYRDQLRQYQWTPLADITSPTEVKVRTAGMVQNIRKITTKKGQAMAFVTLEDHGSELELVVFPQVYQQSPARYEEGQLIFVEGKIEPKQREEGLQLITHRAIKVQDLIKKQKEHPQQQTPTTDKVEQALFIKIPKRTASSILVSLQRLLKENDGHTPVYLHYEKNKKTVLLAQEYNVSVDKGFIQTINHMLGEEESAIVKRKGEA